MKALVKTKRGVGNIELLDMDEPIPGPGEVKVEVKGCSICGTDIHILHDRSETKPPVIMGHEFAGMIVELGEGVEKLQVGDRVVAETTVWSCGTCRYCRTAAYDICPTRLGLGRGGNGAFAKYVIIREKMIHILPAEVDFMAGTLTEPLACCVHGAMEFTNIHGGDLVLVVGDGGIGLLTMQVAKAQGGKVILCGLIDERLKLGAELGADITVHPERDDVPALINHLTDGIGVDIVLECSGSVAGARLALEVLRKQGQYTQIGLFGRPIEFDLEQIAYKELTMRGSFNQQWTSWQRAIHYMREGMVQTRPLVTDILPLSRWQEGFEKYENRQGIKIILVPEE